MGTELLVAITRCVDLTSAPAQRVRSISGHDRRNAHAICLKQWGLLLKEEYFDLIKEAGFDFVRLPVAWSSHADEGPPYLIKKKFFDRIDEVVGWALRKSRVVENAMKSRSLMERSRRAHRPNNGTFASRTARFSPIPISAGPTGFENLLAAFT
jgi:hypothetical protein